MGSKRRRSKAEYAQYRQEQELRAEADEAKVARILDLERQLREVKDASHNNSAAADILTGLIAAATQEPSDTSRGDGGGTAESAGEGERSGASTTSAPSSAAQ